MSLPDPTRVTIVEVGPRDGLQNESVPIDLATKLELIDRLRASGVRTLEATSFVNPSAVPQLADADQLISAMDQSRFDRVITLVPNERGYDRALAARATTVEIFAAATDAFSQANIRCTIDESFGRFAIVLDRARADGMSVRGAVSVAFVCPFSGDVDPRRTIYIANRLLDMGCYEVAVCDTIGRATAAQVDALLELTSRELPLDRVALHMHDTSGLAIDHIQAGLEAGIRTFDAAVGGLGGCPFAPGAPGNVATEVAVAHLLNQDIDVGIDLEQISATGTWIRAKLGRSLHAA